MPYSPTQRGVAYLALSSLLFASMGVLIRLASRHADNQTIVFARNLTGALLMAPWMLRHGLGDFRTPRLPLHIARSIAGLGSMYGFFYALAHMPLANAMVFTYSAPVFIPLIAWLLLSERITTSIVLATSLGFVGVILVSHPQGALLFNRYTLIGLASALLAAVAFVAVRALSSSESPSRIVFLFACISSLISGVLLIGHHPLPPLRTGAELLAVGLLATASQLCLSRAYALAAASRIGPVNYLSIVIAGFYGWLLWGERPQPAALVGVLLILLATLLCFSARRPVPWRPAKGAS